MASVTFQGFRRELLVFLRDLGDNNNREWFAAHRHEYETHCLEPASEFVVALGQYLPKLGTQIHADPRVRGSIFANNRDARFSSSKTPCKTYLDLWFWQGSGPSRARPGYFFRLMPERLVLGAGMHSFSEGALERYRQAVVDPALGPRLAAAVQTIQHQQPGVEIGGQTLKRVPSRSPADHPRATWLRHTSLHATLEVALPLAADNLFSEHLPGVCFEQYERLTPLQRWLVDVLPE